MRGRVFGAGLLGWSHANCAPLWTCHAPAQAGGARIGLNGRVLTRASTLLAGVFVVAFDDEQSAQAAARECRTTAFVAAVTQSEGGGWQLSLRRKNLFPADERDRYASRLRRIVEPHGGRYETFLPDARELRTAERHHERATT